MLDSPKRTNSGGKHARVAMAASRDHLTSAELAQSKKMSHRSPSTGSVRPLANIPARMEPISGKQYLIRKSMLPSVAAELSSLIRITKEDLEAKAVYVLITKLPDMWRAHKSR